MPIFSENIKVCIGPSSDEGWEITFYDYQTGESLCKFQPDEVEVEYSFGGKYSFLCVPLIKLVNSIVAINRIASTY